MYTLSVVGAIFTQLPVTLYRTSSTLVTATTGLINGTNPLYVGMMSFKPTTSLYFVNYQQAAATVTPSMTPVPQLPRVLDESSSSSSPSSPSPAALPFSSSTGVIETDPNHGHDTAVATTSGSGSGNKTVVAIVPDDTLVRDDHDDEHDVDNEYGTLTNIILIIVSAGSILAFVYRCMRRCGYVADDMGMGISGRVSAHLPMPPATPKSPALASRAQAAARAFTFGTASPSKTNSTSR